MLPMSSKLSPPSDDATQSDLFLAFALDSLIHIEAPIPMIPKKAADTADADTMNHIRTILYTGLSDRLLAAHLFAHSSRPAQTIRPNCTTRKHRADITFAPSLSLDALLAD